MNFDISPGFIIGAIIVFVMLFNASIFMSFIRNKDKQGDSAFGKLIKGGKVNFHKDKENIDELSQLLSELKDSEDNK